MKFEKIDGVQYIVLEKNDEICNTFLALFLVFFLNYGILVWEVEL